MPDNSVPSATALTFALYNERKGFMFGDSLRAASDAWDARQPEIDAMRERDRRLREYVTHKPDCPFNTDSCLRKDCSHCACGLAELLAAKEGCVNG